MGFCNFIFPPVLHTLTFGSSPTLLMLSGILPSIQLAPNLELSSTLLHAVSHPICNDLIPSVIAVGIENTCLFFSKYPLSFDFDHSNMHFKPYLVVNIFNIWLYVTIKDFFILKPMFFYTNWCNVIWGLYIYIICTKSSKIWKIYQK